MKLLNEVCTYNCNNGKIYLPALGSEQPCPECSTKEILYAKPEEQKLILKQLNIPQGYDFTNYLDDTLFESRETRNIFSEESIREVSNTLKKINESVFNGFVLKESMYIYAPTADIKLFAYNLLLRAQEQGISVAPLISVNTLYDIQRSRDFDYEQYDKASIYQGAFENLSPQQKQFYSGYKALEKLEVTYSDFLDSDLLILEATANTTEATWFALADILAERENRHLSTFIIGYFSEYQLNDKGAKYLIRDEDSMFKLGKFSVTGLVTKKAAGYRKKPSSSNTPFAGASQVSEHVLNHVQGSHAKGNRSNPSTSL